MLVTLCRALYQSNLAFSKLKSDIRGQNTSFRTHEQIDFAFILQQRKLLLLADAIFICSTKTETITCLTRVCLPDWDGPVITKGLLPSAISFSINLRSLVLWNMPTPSHACKLKISLSREICDTEHKMKPMWDLKWYLNETHVGILWKPQKRISSKQVEFVAGAPFCCLISYAVLSPYRKTKRFIHAQVKSLHQCSMTHTLLSIMLSFFGGGWRSESLPKSFVDFVAWLQNSFTVSCRFHKREFEI